MPGGLLPQPAVKRIGEKVRMRRGVIDARPAPGVHDLMGIAHQSPTGDIGYTLETGNIPRAANFPVDLRLAQPRGK